MKSTCLVQILSLQIKFSGNYEIQINDYAITILFSNVQSDTTSTISGFYQLVLDETGGLHVHYQYEMNELDKDPDKDSFWRECYIYTKV